MFLGSGLVIFSPDSFEKDNKSNPRSKNSIYIDALKRFKEKINAFVQEYHNKNKSYEDDETKEKKVY